jgi:hypothetical protein
MAYANYSVYKLTVSASAGTISYGFYNEAGESDGVERSVEVTGALSLPAVCFGMETACDGCTDPEFADYNPHAGEDTGCEIAPILGCTYADAENYNVNATIEDGSCTFITGNNCPSDINGDGQVGTPDLLEFLSSFGTTCE